MGLYYQSRSCLDCIGLSDGLYSIDWIVSYRLDRIVSAGSYQETLDFMRWLVTGWMGQMEWIGRW